LLVILKSDIQLKILSLAVDGGYGELPRPKHAKSKNVQVRNEKTF